MNFRIKATMIFIHHICETRHNSPPYFFYDDYLYDCNSRLFVFFLVARFQAFSALDALT